MKRAVVAILGVLMLSVLVHPMAEAEMTVTRVAPYDYGQVCARSTTSERCWTAPPFRNPSNRLNPKGDNLYFEAALQAYNGQLRIDSFHPKDQVPVDPYYAAPGHSIYRATSAIWVSAPTTETVITANADIDGLDTPIPESSGFLLCMQVLEWDNVAGQDCVSDYSEIRDLETTATLRPGQKYRIIVFLYDFWGDHVAVAKVNRISYSTP